MRNRLTEQEMIALEIERRNEKSAQQNKDNAMFASRIQVRKESDFFDSTGRLIPIKELTFCGNTIPQTKRLMQDWYAHASTQR